VLQTRHDWLLQTHGAIWRGNAAIDLFLTQFGDAMARGNL
jgi:hypothetical protein